MTGKWSALNRSGQRLRHLLGKSLLHKLADSSGFAGAPQAVFGDSLWWEGPNLWEPPVILALRDIVLPGDVIFDVGANFGGVTRHMARLVGPKGFVVAFECSPRNVGVLSRNVAAQQLSNVYVVAAAVSDSDFAAAELSLGHGGDDSIVFSRGTQSAGVTTWTMDSFCELYGFRPAVVKMDIEGAEFAALQGSATMVQNSFPYLILEQQADDSRCLDWLLPRGYSLYDLNNLSPIRSNLDYPAGVSVRNVLAVPKGRPDPYKGITIGAGRCFQAGAATAGGSQTSLGRLAAGRYLARVRFGQVAADDSVQIGIQLGGVEVLRYHASSAFLASDYSDFPVELSHDGEASFFCRVLARGRSQATVSEVELRATDIRPRLASHVIAP